jgi:hypothetical protein
MKHIHKGWAKLGDEIAQPVGIVLGGNLRENTEPKVKHGSSQMAGGRRILSPEEVKRLGIPTDPVLVISPVPKNPSRPSPTMSPPVTPKS